MMMMLGYLEGMSGIMSGINAQEAGFRFIISRRMGDGFWGVYQNEVDRPILDCVLPERYGRACE